MINWQWGIMKGLRDAMKSRDSVLPEPPLCPLSLPLSMWTSPPPMQTDCLHMAKNPVWIAPQAPHMTVLPPRRLETLCLAQFENLMEEF